MTITAVIALFIARPGGKAAMAVAFRGFVGPAANGTIKGRRHLFHGGDLRGRRPPLYGMAIRDGRSWRWLQGLTAPMT